MHLQRNVHIYIDATNAEHAFFLLHPSPPPHLLSLVSTYIFWCPLVSFHLFDEQHNMHRIKLRDLLSSSHVRSQKSSPSPLAKTIVMLLLPSSVLFLKLT